jgi:hypothetical protein
MAIQSGGAVKDRAIPTATRGGRKERALRARLLRIGGHRYPMQSHARALITWVHGLQVDALCGTGPAGHGRCERAAHGNL